MHFLLATPDFIELQVVCILDGIKIVRRRAGIAAADVRWDVSFVHVRKRARSLFGSYLGLGLSGGRLGLGCLFFSIFHRQSPRG